MYHAILLMLACAMGAGVTAAAVQIPVYSFSDLSNRAYVQGEIARFSLLREELEGQIPTVSPLVQTALRTDLKKVNMILQALYYVDQKGYSFEDPELVKLEYFRRLPPPRPAPPAPEKGSVGNQGGDDAGPRVSTSTNPTRPVRARDSTRTVRPSARPGKASAGKSVATIIKEQVQKNSRKTR